MKVINTLCEACKGQGKIYEWEPVEGSEDMLNRKLKYSCDVCKGEGSIPYVMFTLEEAKAILHKCGIGERYETNT